MINFRKQVSKGSGGLVLLFSPLSKDPLFCGSLFAIYISLVLVENRKEDSSSDQVENFFLIVDWDW